MSRRRIESRSGAGEEALYRGVYEHISDCVFVLDVTPDERFKVLGFNPAEERAVGMKSADVAGKFVEEILPPELAAEVTARYRTCAIERRIVRYEEVLELEKGRTVFSTVLVPVPGPDGRVVRIIGVARDITDAKQAEAATALRQLVLATQSETSPDGILVVDADGRIISRNRRFAEMWRIPDDVLATESEQLGLRWALSQVLAPEAFLARIAYLNEHRNERSREEIHLRDGRTFVRHSAPMLGPDGAYSGRVWYFRDVTEQQRAETQLRQAQKMEAVGQLAGGIAHDFNNLLTAVLTSGNVLEQDLPEGSPLTEDARTVVTAARRGAELTRKLLAFSRQQPLVKQRLSLGRLVEEFAGMARRVVPEDVEIRVRVEPEGSTTVEADAGAIEQILMNLVTNARDAMPGGGRLRIEVERLELGTPPSTLADGARARPYVRVTVSDTGVGMDGATLAHVFEPFFTTKAAGRGTGLGLSSVYGLARQHDGFVEIESTPGMGTMVRAWFPAVTGAAELVECPWRPALPAGGSETILLVEDDPDVRRVAARALERGGYQVLTATNGGEALVLLAAGSARPDLVITDVVMPGMGGAELWRLMGELPGPQRVLFTSGYAEGELARRPVADAGLPFLSKPWEIPELLQKVRSTLDLPPPLARPAP